MTRPIHLSDWSGQPDVHIACGRWTSPAWKQSRDLVKDVHLDDDGELYTFEPQRADCVACVEAITLTCRARSTLFDSYYRACGECRSCSGAGAIDGEDCRRCGGTGDAAPHAMVPEPLDPQWEQLVAEAEAKREAG